MNDIRPITDGQTMTKLRGFSPEMHRNAPKTHRFAPEMHLLVLTLFLLSFPSLGAPVAPSETSHPEDQTREKITGQRVMQTFDFEEREVNYLDLPMYWYKITDREGFPHYSRGKLDSGHARSGQYSFLLSGDGGSVGFRYEHRRIRIHAGSDFQLTGYVHLEKAENCRAQLWCALADRTGKVIPESERTSEPAGTDEQGPDGWAKMELYVPGNFPEAKYITVGAYLLQEEQWNREGNRGGIFRKNIHAECWFDDITILQMPRVILRTDQPGNVFPGEEIPRLLVEVDGVGMADYPVELDVRDMHGHLVYEERWILTGIGDHEKRKSISLPNLPSGLYRAKMDILSQSTRIAERELTFCRMGTRPDASTGSGMNFGILGLDDSFGDWETAFTLAPLSGARLLKLPVWRKNPEGGSAIFSEPNFDKKLLHLQAYNMEVVATFSEIPQSMAMKMDAGRRTLLDVLSQDVELWRGPVAVLLAQYARQVPYWQIGGDSLQPTSWDPRLPTVLETMRGEFRKFIEDPLLTVSLNGFLDVNRDQMGSSRVSVGIPHSIAPEQITEYIADLRNRNLEPIWVTLEPLEDEAYRRDDILIDFAKRVFYAKKGQARTIFIDHPWRQRDYTARSIIEPTELFVVYGTLADQLGATEYVGQFEPSPGVKALLFDRGGSGCLAIWQDVSASGEGSGGENEVGLYLGDRVAAVDLFGNRTAIPSEGGLSRVKVGRWPVLLSGIQTPLALLQGSIRLSPEMIEASITRQNTNLEFLNPFPMSISGRVRFVLEEKQNESWQIEPAVIPFVLESGQTFREAIAMKFPRNEMGGRKYLKAYLTLDADRRYNFEVNLPFEIALPGVEVNIFTRRINGSDLLIQQIVENTGEEEASWNSFIDFPDGSRLERAIPRLGPGGMATKTFPFAGADRWLGRAIRTGIYDPKGTKRINYQININ